MRYWAAWHFCLRGIRSPLGNWGITAFHHAWTNLRQRDYVWAPISKEEYDRLPGWRRWLTRFYRTPLGFSLYFAEIYLGRMIFPAQTSASSCAWDGSAATACWWPPLFRRRWVDRGHCTMARLKCDRAAALRAMAALHRMELADRLSDLSAPHASAHPWFDDQKEWSFYRGQVLGTVHVSFPGPINWITHHIMEHTAHHANMRVPCYNLSKAQASLAKAFPQKTVGRAQILPAKLLLHASRLPALRLPQPSLGELGRPAHQRANDRVRGKIVIQKRTGTIRRRHRN